MVAITVLPEPAWPLLTRLTERVLVFAAGDRRDRGVGDRADGAVLRADQHVGVEVAAGGGLRLDDHLPGSREWCTHRIFLLRWSLLRVFATCHPMRIVSRRNVRSCWKLL
jgi:hypothetical protein